MISFDELGQWVQQIFFNNKQNQMQALKIDGKKARELYPSADKAFKAILEDSFGAEFFSQKITDRIKTFEDACHELGISPSTVGMGGDSKDEIAYKKLKVIVAALNEGWKPNWTNSSEYKYYPWFDLSSGSGLSCNDYGTYYSHSHVGSRLCFKSKELAQYAGKQFLDIYTEFFI